MVAFAEEVKQASRQTVKNFNSSDWKRVSDFLVRSQRQEWLRHLLIAFSSKPIAGILAFHEHGIEVQQHVGDDRPGCCFVGFPAIG